MINNKEQKIISRLLITVFISLIFISCNTDKLKEIPIENFIGVWELQGRQMFNGIKVKIEENEKGELVGKVVEINKNKYVKMFVEQNDIWITGIKRSSNFEFKLNEKKIGSALFALYNQKTKISFKVQFIDKNTFGLATGNSDPSKSSIIYKRLNNN